MPLPDILLQFDHLYKNSPQFQDQLTSFLHKEGFNGCIPGLRDEDVVWLFGYLDKALDSLDPSGPASRKCLRELGSICGTWGKLPPRYLLETSIPSTRPAAPGNSGDVYVGLLNDSRVCVRRLRIHAEESRSTKEVLYQSHRLPLLAFLTRPTDLLPRGSHMEAFVTPKHCFPPGYYSRAPPNHFRLDFWGAPKEYIADNLGMDRLAPLSGIADGLNYLHSRDVVHGDLKGLNIIADDAGCPRIADFGRAMVTQD